MNRRAALFSGRRIGLVVNQADFLISHRYELACALRDLGAELTIFCPAASREEKLIESGFRVVTYPLSRSGRNPFAAIRSLLSLSRLYRDHPLDLVHHVTIKPVLYGTRAARKRGIPAVVNAIPGLGSVYTAEGFFAALRRATTNLLYRSFTRHPAIRVIFQNSEDRDAFVRRRLVSAVDAVIIRGSGVNLATFSTSEAPPEPVSFLLIGRMLADKGVREYVNAARLLRRDHPEWCFRLLGGLDTGNPSAIGKDELEAWHNEGIDWLGHRSDVADQIRAHHVVVLPSYREGMPKTLLEATACGRPIITTDIPGCRDIVRDGVNGLLVQPRVVTELAEAMRTLGEDGALRDQMGRAGRTRAMAFSVEDVVERTLRIYATLLHEQHHGLTEEVIA